jgi:UDP-N-acetylmuramoyl-L-alanyl-D-glutamate--2,6-diaminopimelate ligase
MEDIETIYLSELIGRWNEAVAGTSHPQPPVLFDKDIQITDIVEHTDYVKSGSCFVARVRTESDGHPFIEKAVAKGASVIVGQRAIEELDNQLGGVPYIQVEDSAIAEAWLSAAMFRFPSQHLTMIGVTGTDGKTTTTNIIYEMLRSAGIRSGMLSTIKASIGDSEEPLALHVTTPEAPIIQRYLREMVDAGLTHCVLEVTSHSLAQHRVDAIDFDLAVVTNITHEHLDYHGDYEGYFNAKASLFTGLDKPRWKLNSGKSEKGGIQKTALLNLDDDSYEGLSQVVKAKLLTYAIHQDGDVVAGEIVYSPDRTRFNLHLPDTADRSYLVESTLVGEFNVYNMLAAAGAGHILGLSPEKICRGIGAIDVLDGRMEQIKSGLEFQLMVDFAHTPNGLEKAIGAARDMTDGRIITVFGSAGKRDVAKRRIMAEVSVRDADFTVLTAEDPRTESLEDILAMMADGCRSQGGIEGKNFWRVRDRGRAIYLALSLAQPNDLILVCGKGHEQSMCFNTTEYPWDDRHAALSAIEAFTSGKPMINLGLPTFEDG